MKYNNIAVIYGSDTSECEVSCRSGEFTASHIDDTKYNVYEIFARFGKWRLVSFKKKDSMRIMYPEVARPEVDKSDFSVTVGAERIKFDFAFIMQHGAPGETGQIQGYLEMIGIPFSSCGAFVSAIVFDKFSCKSYLRDVDFVRLAPDVFVRKGAEPKVFEDMVDARLGYPVFVKPTGGGSSFGVSKVKDRVSLSAAVEYAFSESPTAIVEKAVSGREFTCAAYTENGTVKTLPVIEIISENEYFDYDAKYNGKSREVCPAEIPESFAAHIRQTTAKIYVHFGCAGIVRVDYIADGEELYFLEVNTIPGMTNASLVPKMVRAAGLDMTDFLSVIIENS